MRPHILTGALKGRTEGHNSAVGRGNTGCCVKVLHLGT